MRSQAVYWPIGDQAGVELFLIKRRIVSDDGSRRQLRILVQVYMVLARA